MRTRTSSLLFSQKVASSSRSSSGVSRSDENMVVVESKGTVSSGAAVRRLRLFVFMAVLPLQNQETSRATQRESRSLPRAPWGNGEPHGDQAGEGRRTAFSDKHFRGFGGRQDLRVPVNHSCADNHP